MENGKVRKAKADWMDGSAEVDPPIKVRSEGLGKVR